VELILVVRFSFLLLISISLILTACFGTKAWRLVVNPQSEMAGSTQSSNLTRFQRL